MASTWISINTSQRLGARLRACVDSFRGAKNEVVALKAIMDSMVNGTDYSVIETNFGLPTGQGQTTYNIVAGVLTDVGGTNESELLSWLG